MIFRYCSWNSGMMLTVACPPTVVSIAVRHSSVYVVGASMAEEVSPSASDEPPLHESPFVPFTVHDLTWSEFHTICVVLPRRTSEGTALMLEVANRASTRLR